jgi:Protein of unknown function (DUF2786)
MERIAERIRKLLALANNNPSESEAAIALEKASALMAEHNLTMAQVEAHGSGEERVEEKHSAAYRGQTWARLVWGGVAQLNFCLYYYRHNNRGDYGWYTKPNGKIEKGPPREVDEHTVIGTRANVETTKAMVDYLISAIERLAGESEFTSVRDLHAFKLGCARRLEVRLDLLHDKRMKEKRRRQSVASKLPVLADVYKAHEAANRELYAKIYDRPARFSGGGYLGTDNTGAYERGQTAGGRVSLATQVGRGGMKALPKR